MAPSLYDALATMTVIVADTGDLAAIATYQPQDATTNPSLITAAAQMPAYSEVVRAALARSVDEVGMEGAVSRAIDRLAVEFGRRILEIIPGRVSTEVDARLSYDTEATVAKARELMAYYAEAGVERERVLIKIAATWEGIRAAEILEGEGIHCNLTLLFGLHQAVACAEAGVTLISPFVGRILDWYQKETGQQKYPASEDPGVLSVTQIYQYLKKFSYQTKVMGASFRNLGQIIELAGCDLLTLSPAFLTELQQQRGELVQKLHADAAQPLDIERLVVTQTSFQRLHQADRMATAKLAEGIDGFSTALVELETTLTKRLLHGG